MANFDERDDFLVPIDRCIQLCRVFSTLDSSIISSVYYRFFPFSLSSFSIFLIFFFFSIHFLFTEKDIK